MEMGQPEALKWAAWKNQGTLILQHEANPTVHGIYNNSILFCTDAWAKYIANGAVA